MFHFPLSLNATLVNDVNTKIKACLLMQLHKPAENLRLHVSVCTQFQTSVPASMAAVKRA